MSELQLENFFSSFGEVVDVRIVCAKKTGLNEGYGFVNFATTIAHNERFYDTAFSNLIVPQ